MRPDAAVNALWYGRSAWRWLLWPLAGLFAGIAGLRRRLYRAGILRSERLPVPVIVVGNITVGGVGKTPVVIELVKRLQADGYRPGVISRGYGGRVRGAIRVTAASRADEVGDEPRLIASRAGCPVAVAARRVEAARLLLAGGDVDVIVADDGLQHYALARTLEIVVVDGQRRFGNGMRLPAGPLREGVGRLGDVDLVLVNGGAANAGEFALSGALGAARALDGGERRPLSAFAGQRIHAVAGIGHPQRFFEALAAAGLTVVAHAFDDHHHFRRADIDIADADAVLMTEKDAVKCEALADHRHWAVDYDVAIPDAAWRIIRARLTAGSADAHG